MMKFNLLKQTFVFLALLCSLSAMGQSRYNKAVDLFNKGVYVEAQQLFQQEQAAIASTDKTKHSNLDFYNAMCALKLKQSNAEITAESFINKYPDSRMRNDLVFALALHYYDVKKSYREAKKYFEMVKKVDLSQSELGEYNFKYGYTLLKSKKTDEALHFFIDAKNNTHTRFASQAEYYYGHTLYEQGKYAAALESFELLKRDPDFAELVPYYILQIYFYQKEYDKVIAEGEKFYPKAKKTRQGEVARVVAESYLRKGNHIKAREYFDKYEKAAKGKLSAADNYLMAYADFEAGDFANSIDRLNRISVKNDTLGQKVVYLLAGAYISNGNKQKAMTAFEKAGRMQFDEEITTDSQLNHAKLALELKGDSKPMSDFLQNNSAKGNDPEIRNYLIKSYIAEKRFDDAIALVEAIPNPSDSDFINLQKASYFAGLEAYKNKRLTDAIRLFNSSLRYAKYDKQIANLAEYWKAEAQYGEQNYSEAIDGLLSFVKKADIQSNEYKMAHYTLGYCFLSMKKDDEANSWFLQYINIAGREKTPYLSDSYNRIGDNNFQKRNYKKASENYTRAYEMKFSNADYSLYQNAFALGLSGDNNGKRNALKAVASQYPNSQYAPAAYFEIGRMDVQSDNLGAAEKNFKLILNKYKNSSFYRQSLIELGLISINQNKNKDALAYYKRVVDEYPNSPEAQTALAGIKDIYVDMGNVNEYFVYTDKKHLAEAKDNRDSLTFAASERQYLLGDCEKSQYSLNSYLQNYPNGENVLKANYYLGDCCYRSQKFAEASEAFEFVIKQPNSSFFEDALDKYARAKYHLNDFAAAAKAFEQLSVESQDENLTNDAKIFSMRAYYKIENFASTITMARRVEAIKKLDEQIKIEALILKARSLQELERIDEAMAVYGVLAKQPQTPEGAEATYSIIDNLYQNGDVDSAEKKIYAFSDSKTPQASWLARSFIVLANIYIDKNDYFQAKATLESVIQNYKGGDSDILQEAKDALEIIKDKN